MCKPLVSEDRTQGVLHINSEHTLSVCIMVIQLHRESHMTITTATAGGDKQTRIVWSVYLFSRSQGAGSLNTSLRWWMKESFSGNSLIRSVWPYSG